MHIASTRPCSFTGRKLGGGCKRASSNRHKSQDIRLTENRELVVKVVNTNDMTRVLYLRDQSKPVKHVSFDPTGTLLSATSHDGQIYIYSLSSEQPELIKKLDGLTTSQEPDAEASTRAVWHPDGRAFAIATPTNG